MAGGSKVDGVGDFTAVRVGVAPDVVVLAPSRDPINQKALTEILKQIIANNRVGGWRKLKTR